MAGTYQRDPLSVRYDAAAGKLLGQAITQRGRWVYTVVARPVPGPRTREWLRTHGITLDRLDSGGLTAYERAYQRALYWNAKQLGISVLYGTGGSVQREWGPVTARGRQLGIRVAAARDGRLAVRRKPKGQRWTENREQQSGGIGSPMHRFG